MFDFKLQRIKNSIRKHFKFLFELGFRFHSAKYQKEHMGYWEVILQSKDLFVQVYNDRGEIMLSIGHAQSKDDVWYGLSVLVYFITKGEHFIGSYDGDLIDKDKQLQRLSNILSKYLDDIRGVVEIKYKGNKENLQKTYLEILDLYRKEYLKSRPTRELQKYVPKRKDSQ